MSWLLAIVYVVGVMWYHKTIRDGARWDVEVTTANRRLTSRMAFSWPLALLCRGVLDIAVGVSYVVTWSIGLLCMFGIALYTMGIIVLDALGRGELLPEPHIFEMESLGDNQVLQWCVAKRTSSVVLFNKSMRVNMGYPTLQRAAVNAEWGVLIWVCGYVMVTFEQILTGAW